MEWLTHDSPCMPIMPRFSWCEAGKLPRPSRVQATGICARSASARTWLIAPDWMMPCPARIKGRLAVRISSAASAMLCSETLSIGWLPTLLRRRRGEIKLRRGLLRILGDVDQHRARAARSGDAESIAQHRRHIFGAGDDVVVLGHRQRDAGDVHFLKGIGAQHFASHLAGDADQRNRVQHGGGNAGHHVGGAGAGGGNGHTDAAGGPRIAVGHVHRALLMAHQDVADGKFAQRIVGRQDRSAGIAENLAYSFAFERCPDNLRAR